MVENMTSLQVINLIVSQKRIIAIYGKYNMTPQFSNIPQYFQTHRTNLKLK